MGGFALKEHVALSLAIHGNATAKLVFGSGGEWAEVRPALWQEIGVVPGNMRPIKLRATSGVWPSALRNG